MKSCWKLKNWIGRGRGCWRVSVEKGSSWAVGGVLTHNSDCGSGEGADLVDTGGGYRLW